MGVNNTYANRRAVGQCVDCAKPVEESRKGRAMCYDCARIEVLTAGSARQQKADERRARNECPRCGMIAVDGFVHCLTCRTKKRDYQRAAAAAKKGGAE